MTPTEAHEKRFILLEGDLFRRNTNSPDPVRTDYAKHFREIEKPKELLATLRAGDSTDLGGYPLYFVTSDGSALSFDAVRENLHSVVDSVRNGHDDGWRVVAVEINYEDEELFCDHSSEKIPSAYGDGSATPSEL